MVIPENSNTTLDEARFPLSFEDFISKQITPLAKYAYEQTVTRNRNILVASYQCLQARSIDTDTDGNVININGAEWETRISCVDINSYKQHLVNFYGEQENINCHTDAIEQIFELLDPERQCWLYLQQGIFLSEHHVYCLDEQIVSNLVEFPVSLSSWYQSSFVTPNRKPRQQPEQNLEIELFNWLQIHGVEVERQVSTKNHHRLDLWISGRMMLELKAGKVTGDDVCQAIDYYATYQRPIILIGKGLSTAASRGIEGFTREISQDALVFVTWSAVKTYLLGALNIRGYVTG
ncbi:MAG: hypothetical protein KME05_10130 [Gloeocapsa sp. UFS-A4-WI-NPMV-4B04]|nr:hypothetical protein [Gloeocapsa sp. UFS-A4-WI-NPMV-4B04]